MSAIKSAAARYQSRDPASERDPKSDGIELISTGFTLPEIDQFEQGRIWLPSQAPWLVPYEAELFQFPHCKFDDQVDFDRPTAQRPRTMRSFTAAFGP